MLRNNVVTVDLGKIRQNYLLQKSLLPRKTEIMPVVKAAGIDPVYFGVLFIMNNAIGLITPPVGTVLNVVSSVARVNLDTVIKGMFPFLIAETLVMFLLVAFPQLVTVPARWFY